MTDSAAKTSFDEVLAGATMLVATLLTVVAMGHHPSGPGAHGGLANVVHGVMLGVIVATFAGFAFFAGARMPGRFVVLAGLVVYGAGAIGNILAGTINGFAAVELARRGASQDVFAFAWALNQAFAYGAVYATTAAFTLWGADLLVRERGFGRFLGLAGLIAGAIPAALLASGVLRMDVAGAFAVYGLHSIFTALVGLYLLRGRR